MLPSISYSSLIYDSITRTEYLKPYTWNVLDFPKSEQEIISKNPEHIPFLTKEMTKNGIKKLKEGNTFYIEGISLMKDKKYVEAIEKFTLARKSYKRAKLNEDNYNYININQAICHAKSHKEKDKAVASRYISLVTKKIDKEKEWLYNLSIANFMIRDYSSSVDNLSKAIRLDVNYFQAYKTLEEIYRIELKSKKNADKVRDRMDSQEALMIKKLNKKSNLNKKEKTEKYQPILEGKRPNIKEVSIVKDDDNLQFNKVSSIKDRSMKNVQLGIEAYNSGVSNLINGEYEKAINQLKNAEKKLKTGKINIHGLNFSRGNLAIAYLCKGEKNKLGQVKRLLRLITNKIYYDRDWTYNLAVAYYEYGSKARGSSKTVFIKEAIKLMKLSIKHDKLYLDPYMNLVFIYKELEQEDKAKKYQKLYEKKRDELIGSFAREKQIEMGLENEYVFRIHIGQFGEYEVPADLFEEDYLITIPINDRRTEYLAGRFFTLEEAKEYLKIMYKRGYINSEIRAYKDGENISF
tara:strand:+ start:2117 stop:3676 length:1560 start_codon:yes stop_codon:yes gene_type:complete